MNAERFARPPSTAILVVSLWFLWSSVFVAVKLGLETASPAFFAALRVTAAALCLAPVYLLGARRSTRLAPEVHRYALILAGTNIIGLLLLQTLGMANAGVGLAAILLYTRPLVVAVLARVFLTEEVQARQVLGLLLGWTGVVLLVRGELGGSHTDWLSVCLLLIAALCWALGTVVVKAAPAELPIWHLLFWQNLYGSVPLWAVVLLFGSTIEWSGSVVVTSLWAGAAGGMGGFGIQFILLRRSAASMVSAWIFPVPLISAVAGVALLGEVAHLGLLGGGIAVAAGIYFVNAKPALSS